jgi:hypothetical protein
MPPKLLRPPDGTFAAACLMHRERLGLTVREVCDLFPSFTDRKSLSRKTWEQWENEIREPSPQMQTLVIERLSRQRKKVENNSK